MNQGNSYIFGEYWLRLGNHFDGSVGLGYSLYHYAPQNRQSHTYSIWRPRFTARYTIDDYSSLRFNFVRMGSVITLDMLSPVVQDIDGIQQSTGNPDVKPYATYKYELQYQYNRGIFYGKLGAFYTHAPGAIMPEKYWVGDKILSRVDNQKNAEELRFYLNTRINVIPGWLTLSAAPGWHRYWMRGNTYTHTYNNFSSMPVSIFPIGDLRSTAYSKPISIDFGEKPSQEVKMYTELNYPMPTKTGTSGSWFSIPSSTITK